MKLQSSLFVLFLVSLLSSACSSSVPAEPPTPTLAPGMGKVVGVVQIRDGEMNRPARGAILYLGGVLKDSAGQERVAAVDRLHYPKAIADSQGRFSFINVPPGHYGLFVDAIQNMLLLSKPDSDDSLIVDVLAGTPTDLGTLVYDSLPLPPEIQPYPYP